MDQFLSNKHRPEAAQDLLSHGGNSLLQRYCEWFQSSSVAKQLLHLWQWTPLFAFKASCRISAADMLCFSASLCQCKLIVCQMSNTRCKPLSLLLLPMSIVVLLVISGTVQGGETLILFIWTAVVLLTHIHYGVSVVSTDLLILLISHEKAINLYN